MALVSSLWLKTIAINYGLLSFCRQSSVYLLDRILWDLNKFEQKFRSYLESHQPLSCRKYVCSLRMQIRSSVLIEDKYVIFDGKYAKQGPIEAVSSVSYDKLLLITKLWSLQLREKQTAKLLKNLLFFPCNSSVRTSENNSILSGACFSYHKNFRKIIRTMWTR